MSRSRTSGVPSPFLLKSLIAHRRDAEYAKSDRTEIIHNSLTLCMMHHLCVLRVSAVKYIIRINWCQNSIISSYGACYINIIQLIIWWREPIHIKDEEYRASYFTMMHSFLSADKHGR